MTDSSSEDRRLLVSMSIGQTAYAAWARQARRERFFNIARLLEASAAVKQVRAEHALYRLGEVSKTIANIDRALAGLEPEAVATGPVTGTSPFQRELLERAVRALAAGRDLTYTELGDLFVCSTCGHLMEGDPPPFCPECGTVREGFLSFRIVDGMGTLGPSTIVRRLEQGMRTVQDLVRGLTEEQLSTPVNGLPAFKDLIGHLIDMDIVFRERAWMILETNQPKLSTAHPPTLQHAMKYRTVPIDDLLEQYISSRQQTLNLLRGLTQAAWQRIGFHEIFGPVPLLHQGNWVVSHEQGHLIELAQMRHNLLHKGNQAVMVVYEAFNL
ncbi:DinB family protein [Chloroflexus sp. MS-CIW-1]|jgi:rubrerythrin|uniref:DinB family protein n=1 Tax=Chloroflexus sp. MS-CIW-1 TaxID=3055768 RepID=UPI002647BF1C|nr:DinB family protein [Chloroflexus sp. MS-CIW-1]MDN5273987.1 DinB family protein [Chloroflexus sp. MS-CIW-1]